MFGNSSNTRIGNFQAQSFHRSALGKAFFEEDRLPRILDQRAGRGQLDVAGAVVNVYMFTYKYIKAGHT